MKKELLEFLCCPVGGEDFSLVVDVKDGDEIMEGKLLCSHGAYPILHGVPRLLPSQRDERNWETARRFGEEWTQFSMLTDQYEKQFLSWIEPVTQDHFVGKAVLDVGCGKGRHVLQAKKFGAKNVIGIDLSHAVDAAFQNVGRMDGVHIIQGDVYAMPLKPVFDYAYSIGVLHHTPDPKRSFLRMVDMVKLGGSISAWVYGREGNWWIIYILNPIRFITSKLPLSLTKGLAFLLAGVLQAVLRALYAPAVARPWLKKILPYSSYLCSISGYSFQENYSIVFDHLLPEIAFYLREDEVRDWFKTAGLTNVVITQRYGNSWRGFGVKTV